MNSHFIEPDYYLISYWPGEEQDENVTTIRTESNFHKKNIKISSNFLEELVLTPSKKVPRNLSPILVTSNAYHIFIKVLIFYISNLHNFNHKLSPKLDFG